METPMGLGFPISPDLLPYRVVGIDATYEEELVTTTSTKAPAINETPNAPSEPATRNTAAAKERAILAARSIADTRGRDVLVLELHPLLDWVDYMVIATGSSRRQICAMADEIETIFRPLGEFKMGGEGYDSGSWVAMDFGDVLIHLFNDAKREYYQLEHLWADAPRIDWRRPSDVLPNVEIVAKEEPAAG